MGWYDDFYKKIKAKFLEEKEDYKNSSGLGVYISSNLTTLASRVAKDLGYDELAEKIEDKRPYMFKLGNDIDDKAREEYKQYQESDGFSQYVAQNVVTLARDGAKAIGEDELAEKIEAERDNVLGIGKAIDDKAREEYKQYQESDGFSQYIAQNVVTLAREGAKALGKDEWAEKIEAERGNVLGIAKNIDDKAREEYKQYQESDGFSQYVAQNVVTLAKEGAKALGKDEWAEKIEAERGDVLGIAKNIDDKVREEYKELVEGEKLDSENGKKNNFTITEIEPLYGEISYPSGGNENNVGVIERKSYERAMIKVMHNTEDDSITLGAMIDGKVHGAVFNIDKDGGVLDVELYNHGEKINTNERNVKAICIRDENGCEHWGTLLDGNKFGWEMVKDNNGLAKVAFYDENMFGDVSVKELGVNEHFTSKKALLEELKEQKGDLPKLTGQYALSQAKCDLVIHNVDTEDLRTDVDNAKEKFEKRITIKSELCPNIDLHER